MQKVSTYVPGGNQQLNLESEHVYQQYDNKKNPLIEKMYNAQGGVDETTVNEFTYDAAGYPVTLRVTVTSANGTPTVRTANFFY